MAIELVMPKLGLTMKEGLIVNLLKAEGDAVQRGEGVFEIETEKLTNVIESPADGVLLKVVGQVGDSLPIAAVLAYIGEPGESVPDGDGAGSVSHESKQLERSDETQIPEKHAEAAAQSVHRADARIFASPAARALAKALGVDYTKLSGSGPGGRIVKKDVEAAGSGMTSRQSTLSNTSSEPVETIPYSGMRRTIGTRMLESWQTTPMVTHHVKADLTELLALRVQLNKNLSEGAVKIGVLDMLIKIIARAIRAFPIVNAALSGDEILIPDQINMGIAVAVNDGLVVPVLRDADKKSLFTVSREIKELIGKVRNGRLALSEISGSTFTVSNLGGYGSVDFFTPIINPPESAILGICRTQEEPVVRGGEIVIRSMTGLSFTFDHRVVDGAPAAEFLAVILKELENPARAVFED